MSAVPVIDRALCLAVTLAVIGLVAAPPFASAQSLPRVEGPLTMEQAVELAREKEPPRQGQRRRFAHHGLDAA